MTDGRADTHDSSRSTSHPSHGETIILETAANFLDDVRRDMARAATEGFDLPPRLRSIHERAGHATPEYRTFQVPVPQGDGLDPTTLSRVIAEYAVTKSPTGLILALDVLGEGDDGEPQSIFIAEARHQDGTRLYMIQPYSVEEGVLNWHDPAGGGWQDPGDQEMILDGAFL